MPVLNLELARESRLTFKTVLTAGSVVILIACGDLKIDRGVGGPGVRAITASVATIDTPSTLEYVAPTLRLKQSAILGAMCTYSATGSNTGTTGNSFTSSSNFFTSLNIMQSNLFTMGSYIKFLSATLRIRRTGAPTGNMFVELRTTTVTDPTATVLATSSDVLISSAGTNADGTDVNFSFPTPYEATGGGAFALVLRPQADAVLDGTNDFRWVATNSSGPDGCSDFPIFRSSSDTGSTWNDGFNLGYRRNYFSVNASAQYPSGSASWIITGWPSGEWEMSTFTMTENTHSSVTGTITYDVGAGASVSTATYDYTGLTLAQVQALANLEGDYFYLRANFAVPSPYYSQATLLSGSINNP
jgi:hypothetical protein